MPGLIAFRRTLAISALVAVSAAPAGSAPIVRTFTFSSSDVSVGTDDHGFAFYTLKGSQPWGVPGGPEIPAVSVLMDLPAGMKATRVSSVPSGFVSIGGRARVRPLQK